MKTFVKFNESRDGKAMSHVDGKVAFPERGGPNPRPGEVWEVQTSGESRNGRAVFLKLVNGPLSVADVDIRDDVIMVKGVAGRWVTSIQGSNAQIILFQNDGHPRIRRSGIVAYDATNKVIVGCEEASSNYHHGLNPQSLEDWRDFNPAIFAKNLANERRESELRQSAVQDFIVVLIQALQKSGLYEKISIHFAGKSWVTLRVLGVESTRRGIRITFEDGDVESAVRAIKDKISEYSSEESQA